MIQSVSKVGTSTKDKQKDENKKKLKKRKRWRSFHFFVIVSSVLILVMWGIIIFGGHKAPPRTIDFAKNGEALLFMVDAAIKRYAIYEGNRYPEELSNLVPKYLTLRKEELFRLEKLSYQTDAKAGYRLSLAKTKPGQMNIILTPKGVEFSPPARQGA